MRKNMAEQGPGNNCVFVQFLLDFLWFFMNFFCWKYLHFLVDGAILYDVCLWAIWGQYAQKAMRGEHFRGYLSAVRA